MFTKDVLDFNSLNEQELKETLKEYKLTLTPEEALKVQNEILKRPPSVTECILWSIQGSEHSSYKSSRPFLRQLHTKGPNVILGPSEDAGIVEIARDNNGDKYGIVMSHESHNHPSQIVPYEGAATGIGGNVRDVCCMGSKVIATGDPLRFGDIKRNKSKWIHEGVVAGIAGYGNPIGVPNLCGDLYYDESYNDNCLVNVLTLGVLKEDEIIHSFAPEDAKNRTPEQEEYDLILVGKPTDNSGFSGASFASLELKEEEKEQNKGAVQEPNAFLKRHILKSTYELYKILKEKGLLDKVGFKDLGAGGIACASVELADPVGLGAEVYLDKIHIGMEGLHPGVILCSETQERFMWTCDPSVTSLIVDHYNKTFDMPNVSAGAMASVVGKIRQDGQYVVYDGDYEIINAKATQVTQGLQYDRKYTKPEKNLEEPDLPEPENYNETFLKILAHENVCSREAVYEQYDKQVQGISVIEPGKADAGVIQPFKDGKYPEEIRKTGIALKADHNPRYGKISAYWGAINSTCESMRNIACVGATPHALTDCLCYGNPEKPEQMWEFVEGVRGVAEAGKNLHLKDNPDSPVPIISGNVSFYNESKGSPISPSAVIGCLGKLEDVTKAITMSFKNTDSIILMVGERKDELGGSVYYQINGELGVNIPKPEFKTVENEIFALTDAIDKRLILSAHDISDGGIATTLAEMSFESEIGLEVDLSHCHSEEPKNPLRQDKILWSETGGFVLEIKPENLEKVKEIFNKRNIEVFKIGKTTEEKNILINNLIDCSLNEAKKVWTNSLREKLG